MGENQSRIKFINAPAFLDSEGLIAVIIDFARNSKKSVRTLVYHFVSREKIQDINIKHLRHNYETDVITFNYCTKKAIKGDVFICVEVVEENANDLKVSINSELNRVVFHGFLHLLGFNDSTDEERLIMRTQEEKCLALV
jgi:rRNA maturation RNase YbeY